VTSLPAPEAPAPDAPEPGVPAPEVVAVRALARAVRVLERSCDGLSLPHYRVLSAIASGEERASRVAARLAVGKPTISASVESLCQRGLIARQSVADDQRAVTLSLTPDGEILLHRVEIAMVARIRELAARTRDADAVLEMLGWLGAAIDEAAR
jgi:DNA-binding MarR family transcriptional regulator